MEGKKIISNNIADLIIPVSSAYWIIDDGSFTGSGLKLHTNVFKLEELKLLVEALEKILLRKLQLLSLIEKNNSIIYIFQKIKYF